MVIIFCRKQVARLARLTGKYAPDVADLNHPDVPVIFPGLRHEALILPLLGSDNGVGARSAVGMGSLPGNIPVEVEVIFELKS